jgi:hypothetical protein
MNQYLILPTYAEAAALDQQVMQHLRATQNANGSSWSGVFSDGTQFAILWDEPVAAVTGGTESNPALVITSEGEWVPYTPPAPEETANDPR